jgi:hypothetical protein
MGYDLPARRSARDKRHLHRVQARLCIGVSNGYSERLERARMPDSGRLPERGAADDQVTRAARK